MKRVEPGATPVDDGRCFACGPKAVHGLHLRFEEAGTDAVRARLALAPEFQGWAGVAHGGIVATLLDEAMAHAAGARGLLGVTAELKLRFRKPVPLGVPLVVFGRVLWQRRNVLGLEASVGLEDGTILAVASGSFLARGTLPEGARLGRFDAG